MAELAPRGALQTVLARRIVAATWRLERAERLAAGTGLGPRSPTWRPTGGGFCRKHPGYHQLRPGPDPRLPSRAGLRGPCCAIAAARSPSCGAPCAPSKRSRSMPSTRARSRRDRSRRPRARTGKRQRTQQTHNQTNRNPAGMLAIRAPKQASRQGHSSHPRQRRRRPSAWRPSAWRPSAWRHLAPRPTRRRRLARPAPPIASTAHPHRRANPKTAQTLATQRFQGLTPSHR